MSNTVKTLNVAKFIKKDTEAWLTYPNTEFEVLVRYLRKSELRKLLDDCTEKTTDLMTGEVSSEVNSEEFKRRICTDVIKDWRNLTIGLMKQLMPMDEEALEADGYTDEDFVPCDMEAKLCLMNESFTFDKWLNQVVGDIKKIRESQKAKDVEELKKSGNGDQLLEK